MITNRNAVIAITMTFVLFLQTSTVATAKPLNLEEAQKQELFDAIKNGDQDKVKSLIANDNTLIEAVDERGLTPIMLAAHESKPQLVKFFIEKGANIQAKNGRAYQALHFAAKNGDFESVKMLIEAGVSVNTKVQDGTLPINFAAWSGDYETTVYLEEQGGDYKAIVGNKANMLMWSSLGGNAALYDRYEDLGVSRDFRDNDGDGPLHWAATGESAQMVKHLVKKKNYDLRDKNEKGAIAMQIGLEWGKLETTQTFLELGIAIDEKNSTGGNWLLSAARSGNVELIKLLVEKGCSVNGMNKDGTTPLNEAALSGNVNAVAVLVENGAKVNPKDCLGEGCNKVEGSPLHNSVWRNPEVVRYLINNGAIVNALNEKKQTPLHIAVWGRCVECVRVLVDAGAELNAQDIYGKTALHYAIKRERKDIVHYLLEKDVDVNLVDNTGKTALHLASICGFCDIMDGVIAKDTNLQVKDKEGNSALYFANYYGNNNSAKKLLAAGASPEVFNMPDYCHEPVKNGDATVWYLNHSGWAIKTANNLLVFDYWQPKKPSDKPCINNGYLCGDQLKDEKVTVFVSHTHADHYDKSIFDWKENGNDITYVLGFDDDVAIEYTYLKPHEPQKVNGIKVTPIESTDSGEGFLVEIDGITIYHPGDHANGDRNDPSIHNKEIDYLATQYSNIDIAFFPSSGCRFSDKVALKQGVYYTVEKLQPRVAFPMHGTTREDLVYPEFAAEGNENTNGTEFISSINYKGDRYFYTSNMDASNK